MKGMAHWLKSSSKMKRWIFLILVGIVLTCYGIAKILVQKEMEFIDAGKVVVIFVIGFTCIVLGLIFLNKRNMELFIEATDDRMKNKKNVNVKSLIFDKTIYDKGPKIVAIGGGAGLNTVLAGMKRYTDNVLITYDSDEAGVKAALRAIPILKEAGLSTKVINMRPYKDPDEFIKALGTEAFQERIDKAENSFMYEIGIIEKNYNRSDPESETAFEREVANIRNGDAVRIENFYTVGQLFTFLDLDYSKYDIMVNNMPADKMTKVYENFTVDFNEKSEQKDYNDAQYEDIDNEDVNSEDVKNNIKHSEEHTSGSDSDTDGNINADNNESNNQRNNESDKESDNESSIIRDITIIVNNAPVTLSGKSHYILVDLFQFYDFDLSKPKGNIVILLNGETCEYTASINDGDVVKIYWE